MKTNSSQSTNHRLSFIIEAWLGVLMLVLSGIGYVLEKFHPPLQNSLTWGFMVGAIISLFLASLSYSRYLAQKK